MKFQPQSKCSQTLTMISDLTLKKIIAMHAYRCKCKCGCNDSHSIALASFALGRTSLLMYGGHVCMCRR